MNQQQPSGPMPGSPPPRRSAVVQHMLMPVRIEEQTCLAIRAIVAIRLLAICTRTGNEPLPLLSQRLASVTAAKAFIAFADLIGTSWPETFSVMRPCCRIVSPDEATLAQMIDAVAAGNRAQFGRALDGFVRSDRQDALFISAAQATALLA